MTAFWLTFLTLLTLLSSPAQAAPTPTPSGATLGVIYLPASTLATLTQRRSSAGWTAFVLGGRVLQVRPSSVQAYVQQGSTRLYPLTLSGTPYLEGGQLYLPLKAVTALGCTFDTAGMTQSRVSLSCAGRSLKRTPAFRWPAAKPRSSVPAPRPSPVVTSTPHTPPSSGRGYTNVDGQFVPSPTAASSAPPSASAQCRDGTYSFSMNRRGTCSRHGGVAAWL